MKRFLIKAALFCMTCSVAFSGCRQQPADSQLEKASSTSAPLIELSNRQQEQRNRAVAAKEELFKSLLGELTTSIGENGIAQSIEVCKTKAPELAKSVSEESNLKIGRTSFLLRNNESVPPAWAASYVNDRFENEVDVDLGDNRLGVLLPIRLKAACIKCHGKSDALDASVKEAIATHYPEDMATGFAEGDLRGYFWVEVPVPTQ